MFPSAQADFAIASPKSVANGSFWNIRVDRLAGIRQIIVNEMPKKWDVWAKSSFPYERGTAVGLTSIETGEKTDLRIEVGKEGYNHLRYDADFSSVARCSLGAVKK